MNEQSKIRIAILLFAGVLLVGGAWATIAYNSQKQQEAQEQADQTAAPHSHMNKDKRMSASGASGGSGTPAAVVASAKPSAEDAKEAKDDEEDKSATKPGAPQPAGKSANAAAAQLPVSKGATATATATNPTKPLVVAAAAPGKTPLVTATQAAVNPGAVKTPPVAAGATQRPPVPVPAVAVARPPVVPAKATAVLPPTPAAPALPAVRPAAVAARPPAAPALPATTAAAPAAKQKLAALPLNGAPGKGPDAQAPDVPVHALPPKAGTVIATTYKEAAEVAHKEAGRTNPTLHLTAFQPWPRAGAKGAGAGQDGVAEVPPPPGGAADNAADTSDADTPGRKPTGLNNTAGHIADKLVPPPPPDAGGGGGADDLNLDQLPVPPSKPIIGDQMKVLSVLDDKAIVSFPRDLCTKNNWPKVITLGTGEQFDSIKIISVSPDGVTIEEDGERSLRPLPTIK